MELRVQNTKDESQHPWIFRCPKSNCYYIVSALTEEDAKKAEATHECPYQGGITKLAGSITMTLVEDMWAKADQAFSAMSEEDLEPDEYQRRRGVVRGMCDMIAIFSPPHFRTSDEIGRELMKRAAAHQAGEDYETPGLHGRRYEMPAPTPRLTRVAPSLPKTEPGPFSKVTETEKEAIKFAKESGMFSDEQIAKTYHITPAQVRQIAAS